MPLSSPSALGAALVDQVQRDLVVGGRQQLAVDERRRGPPRGCRPRRCRRGRRSRRAVLSGCWPPPTSTIESRRWPSQLPLTCTAPRSSGPRCASRSSIRSSASGSEPPCSATIPHMRLSVTTRPFSARSRAPSPRAAAARRRRAAGRRGGRCRAGSRGPRRGRPRRPRGPRRAPVRGEHARRSGSTTLAEPRKRSGPHGPGLVRPTPRRPGSRPRASGRRGRSGGSGCRRGCRRAGCMAVGGPGRQRADDVGAVEGERARRLGEELVVTEQHPDPADRGVEGGEAVARACRRSARRAAGGPCAGGRARRRR